VLAASRANLYLLDPVTLAPTYTRAVYPTWDATTFLDQILPDQEGRALLLQGLNGTGFVDSLWLDLTQRTLTPFAQVYGDHATAVSGDGRWIAIGQSGTSPPQAFSLYDAWTGTTTVPWAMDITSLALDRDGDRLLINGQMLLSGQLTQLGFLPSSTSLAVLSPDGMRAYTLDTAGTLRTFNLSVSLSWDYSFPEIGTGVTPVSDPGSMPSMIVLPGGGAVVIAGSNGIVVQPVP
jgi:hypothetical protein